MASMRPPQFAGEDYGRCVKKRQTRKGFNEAPAVRGGRSASACFSAWIAPGFNEAPAVRGGRSKPSRNGQHIQLSFNEAPAVRGGRFGGDCLPLLVSHPLQ